MRIHHTLLFSTLVSVLVLGLTRPVLAQSNSTSTEPLELNYSASFFTRYELRTGFDDLGASRARFLEGDAVTYRARLGARSSDITLGHTSTAHVQLALQASGFLGEQNTTVADPALGLYQGYVHVATPRWQLDVGRFAMNYGDALVIGNLDWHQTARAFSGLRLHWNGVQTPYRVDVFATQSTEGRPATGPYGAGDTYFYGVYAMFGPALAERLALDVYALGLSWPETDDVPVDPLDPGAGTATRASATTATLGARLRHTRGALDVRVETGLQLGTRLGVPGMESRDVFAYHADVEIGVRFGSARVSAELLYASGDDPDSASDSSWNQLFPTAHKWLGLSDVFGARSNVYGGAAHAAYQLNRRMTAKLDGHVFMRPQPVGGVTGYAGMEIDAQFVYALGRGLIARGLYGVFIPDADTYSAVDDPAQYIEIELRYDFD